MTRLPSSSSLSVVVVVVVVGRSTARWTQFEMKWKKWSQASVKPAAGSKCCHNSHKSNAIRKTCHWPAHWALALTDYFLLTDRRIYLFFLFYYYRNSLLINYILPPMSMTDTFANDNRTISIHFSRLKMADWPVFVLFLLIKFVFYILNWRERCQNWKETRSFLMDFVTHRTTTTQLQVIRKETKVFLFFVLSKKV